MDWCSSPPLAGEAVVGPAEGTLLPVTPDAFSTTVANLFKILDFANQETLLEVPIEYSSVQQPRSSLMSLDNSVIFEGSSFSLSDKHMAKSCEAKSLDSPGKQLLPQLLPFTAPTCPLETEVSEPETLTLEFEMIYEMEDVGL
ncbi:hypothetical protein Tco_0794864 [Tanacetum coccineum]